MSEGLLLGDAPLLLASTSAARRQLLTAAGIPFEAMASGVNEREVEAPLLAKGGRPDIVAEHLARAKAHAVASRAKGRFVLGADQTLDFEGRLVTKPASEAEARAQLLSFSGKQHRLHSALCLARHGQILFETVATSKLVCRAFSAEFIDSYMRAVGDGVLASVGAYQIEGLGVHLFEKIEGDHATIMGLPLLPLLAHLRREGLIVA
ncbi:MAG TPA: Maf family protein [Methylovirgula sp.]